MVQHTSFRVNNRCIAGGLQSIRWKTKISFSDPNESRNLLFALLPWGINNNNNKSSSNISHNINNNSNSSFPKSSSCQVFTYLNYDVILQHKIFCYMHKKPEMQTSLSLTDFNNPGTKPTDLVAANKSLKSHFLRLCCRLFSGNNFTFFLLII